MLCGGILLRFAHARTRDTILCQQHVDRITSYVPPFSPLNHCGAPPWPAGSRTQSTLRSGIGGSRTSTSTSTHCTYHSRLVGRSAGRFDGTVLRKRGQEKLMNGQRRRGVHVDLGLIFIHHCSCWHSDSQSAAAVTVVAVGDLHSHVCSHYSPDSDSDFPDCPRPTSYLPHRPLSSARP